MVLFALNKESESLCIQETRADFKDLSEDSIYSM